MLSTNNIIGARVTKISKRPFKSTLKINTVKSMIKHPITLRDAYTFEEDDSYVEIIKCRIV